MNLTGAIFDLDGTILDSMSMWDNLGANYLKSVGKTPKDDISERLKEMSLQTAAQYFIDEYGVDKTQEEVCQGINQMSEDFYKNEALLKEGVIEFLDYLKANNVRICLATATDRYLANAALNKNNAKDYFEEIFTCTEVGESKSSSKIYDEAIKFLGTDKESTYIFEDILFAMQTAKKAGYNVAGIYDRFSHKDMDNIKDLADIYFMSYSEMRDYFD